MHALRVHPNSSQTQHAPQRGALPASYYIKIKLSRNSGAATSGTVGRRPLKFGVRVRHQKCHGDPRAFRDCVTWPRARSRKHAFRARGPFMRPFFAPSNPQCPLEIHMREDGDNSAQSGQVLSALALVLHNTQSTSVQYPRAPGH